MKIRKVIDITSILIAGISTIFWMWKGYDILLEATIILLLWMIYVNTQNVPIDKD